MILQNNVPVVLLVENNPDDVELTRLAFAECGVAHELIVVWDGEEALDYLFTRGRYAGLSSKMVPQLVLMDMALPKIDGWEVLKVLRRTELGRTPPVVMLTSSNQRSDVKNSYLSGANSYIQKPVDFSQFVSVVRMLAQYWLKMNLVLKA